MRKLVIPLIAASALTLGGCASNYGGEGALAGGVAGALIGGDAGGAAIGAGVGAGAGSLIKKDGDTCYYRDRDGRRYRERC